MVPTYLNQSGYLSCIKIAGTAILPPLITEERRKELNEDKVKAVELEKRIVRKRSSIDSGVMTGSYIDNLKNSEMSQIESSSYNQLSISDLAPSEDIQKIFNMSYSELDNITNDNFLRSALEDTEFREFFYSTAERIFKDNNIINVNNNLTPSPFLLETNHTKRDSSNETTNSEISSHQTNFLKSSDSLDHSFCGNLTLVPSAVRSNQISEFLGTVNSEQMSTVEFKIKDIQNEEWKTTQKNDSNTFGVKNNPKITIEKPVSPPQRLIRRNSYTLESPSPVLLEHMAKENTKIEQENEKWKSFSDRKHTDKGLGFKTFLSAKKLRNKKVADQSFNSRVNNSHVSKSFCNPLKRSKTFIKTNRKSVETNYSLPCSSRSSPIHKYTFAHSFDCIPSMFDKPLDVNASNVLIHEPIKEVTTPQYTDSGISATYDNKYINMSHPVVDIGFAIPKTSNTSLLNNTSGSLHSNCNTDVLFNPQYEPSDLASQISSSTQSTYFQQNSVCSINVESRNIQKQKDQSCEMDDSASMCSSLSLSKYMPLDDSDSRPSTTEDLAVVFSQLQLQHERQISELLERQHKEKLLLSKVHSNSGTMSSRSTANLSGFDFPCENSCTETFNSEEKRSSCSRELFPMQNLSSSKEIKPTTREFYSEKDKAAALKLTAHVRGYLTRRLLKTEKVQQLIDVIKESLNCAFSLQSETQLKRDDLELHKRLEHQLNAAFYELHSVISAPVARRMAIIAADREKLRKPISRPSSTISSATRKSLLRRQQSLNIAENKSQEMRLRTKSLCVSGNSGLTKSASSVKSDSSSVTSTNSNRKPWR